MCSFRLLTAPCPTTAVLDLQTERDLAVEKAVGLTRRVRSLETENRQLARSMDGTGLSGFPGSVSPVGGRSASSSSLQGALAPKDKSAVLEIEVGRWV